MMNGYRILLEEVGDDVFDIHKGDIKISVYDHFVKFRLIRQLLFSFLDALLETVFAFRIAIGEAANECFLIWWRDEYHQSIIAIGFLDILCAFDIHVEKGDLSVSPDALDLALQRTVELPRIDLFTFHEVSVLHALLKFCDAHEVVFLAIDLSLSLLASGA